MDVRSIDLTRASVEHLIELIAESSEALQEIEGSVGREPGWSGHLDAKLDGVYRTRLRHLFSLRQSVDELSAFAEHLNAVATILRYKAPSFAERVRCYEAVVNDALEEVEGDWVGKILQKDHVREVLAKLGEAKNAESPLADIRKSLGLKPANASRVLNLMQSVGLISRHKIGKSTVVRLSAAGIQCVNDLKADSHPGDVVPFRQNSVSILRDRTLSSENISGAVGQLHLAKAIEMSHREGSSYLRAAFHELLEEQARAADAEAKHQVGLAQGEFVKGVGKFRRSEMPLGRTPAPEALLDAISSIAVSDIDATASAAAQALKELNFTGEPLRFGVSEYHQERLIFNVANAALSRNGFSATKLERADWRDAAPRKRTGRDISMSAKVIDLSGQYKRRSVNIAKKRQPTGVFEFQGLSVFVRSDALLRVYSGLSTAQRSIVDDLLSGGGDHALGHEGSREVRAQIAAQLNIFDMNDPGLESVYESINALIGQPNKTDKNKSFGRDPNHQRFRAFIEGRSDYYSGGAINASLLREWWCGESEEYPIIELLDFTDIRSGLARYLSSHSDKEILPEQVIIENFLNFDGCLNEKYAKKCGKSALARKARLAVVNLCREIGFSLSKTFSGDSTLPKNEFNAAKFSAFTLLAPMPPEEYSNQDNNYMGEWSFVAHEGTVPAMIEDSDRYYEMQGAA